MKSIAKVICCSVALAWLHSATAGEKDTNPHSAAEHKVTDTSATSENGGSGSVLLTGGSSGVSTPEAAAGSAVPAADTGGAMDSGADGAEVAAPPAQKVPVQARPQLIDRTQIEKRMETEFNRTKKRTADAEKDVADRAAKKQQ
ncbi:MAG TPA: hypothetical protein VFP33_11760 [Gallionella sp.]|nr:hypothetical protein [Gallionella sp.]